jgi:N-acetyl-anhydromuramyl-L-alanine amidase AmpD
MSATWKSVDHDYTNGGDAVHRPEIYREDTTNRVRIIADADCDADGSPRAKQIDPGSGQVETSLSWDNGWEGSEKYVNAETIPYFVLPGRFVDTVGVRFSLGDIARISYGDRSVYAIFADTGPERIIGEASIKTIESLGGKPWNSRKTKITRGLPHGVEYLILPNSAHLGRTRDFDSIQEYGAEVFRGEAFGPETPRYPGILRNGSKGNSVAVLQSRLEQLGYDCQGVDGDFGAYTEGAVKKFETEHNLDPDGIVDPLTWSTLWGQAEPDRASHSASSLQLLWIPFARRAADIRTSWTYETGYPAGAVIHFTAGSSGTSSLDYLREMGYPCLVIDRDGTIYQSFPLNRGGAHTGTWHHRKYVGIEIAAAGQCSKLSNGSFQTYWGAQLPANRVRCSSVKKDNAYPGCYEAFTGEQEESLRNLLLWLKHNNPDVFSLESIVGHDEACDSAGQIGRKNDPGFALSMTMPEYRAFILESYRSYADA